MFGPGEIIFKKGDYENSCLYYILKGQVELIMEKHGNNDGSF